MTASAINLGRFMASQSVGGASTLATTGDDDSNTRVTVNGTLFNSATSTSTYNLASGTYALGAVSGAVNLPVTGEGLTGEGPYSDVQVNYGGNALQQRRGDGLGHQLGSGRPLHGQPERGRGEHAGHHGRRRQQHPRDGQRHALQLGHDAPAPTTWPRAPTAWAR